MKHAKLVFSFIILIPGLIHAQEESSKYQLNGYLSHMPSVMFSDIEGDWISDNLLHNRINLYWYPKTSITTSIQIRNRFIYGESVSYYKNYASIIDEDNSYLDLSVNLFNEKSFLLNSNIDRMYFQYSKSNFVLTAGRQRINWALNYVWNPNDIFNVQNYFDFDYIEKPGSDAFRIQYYTGPTSVAELAAKLDARGKLTSAAYYRFNKLNYDIQVLGGIYSQSDFIAGAGFSGDIKDAGFRGEITYLHPVDNISDTSGIFYFGVSADYTFRNSLSIQGEILYSKLSGESFTDFLDYYQGTLDLKQISFSEISMYTSISYVFTPLMTGNLSIIYFPDFKAYYTGPGIDYSLKENLQFSFILQYLSGEFPDPSTMVVSRQNVTFAFLRYKFSF